MGSLPTGKPAVLAIRDSRGLDSRAFVNFSLLTFSSHIFDFILLNYLIGPIEADRPNFCYLIQIVCIMGYEETVTERFGSSRFDLRAMSFSSHATNLHPTHDSFIPSPKGDTVR